MMRLAPILTLFLCLVTMAAPATPRYSVQILPILPTGMNNKGHIVGSWKRPRSKITTAVLLVNGKILDLDPKDKFAPPEKSNKALEARAINDRDEVIGQRVGSGSLTFVVPFFWAKGSMRELPKTECWCRTLAINNTGEMVGYSNHLGEDMGDDAVYWPDSSSATNLGQKMGWPHSTALAINNHSDIVGKWQDAKDKWHAFLLSNGHLAELEFPDADRIDCQLVQAEMNDKRQVVGTYGAWASSSSVSDHAFLWQRGKFRELGSSTATPHINDRGQIVGDISVKGKKDRQPYLWSDSECWNLNTLIPRNRGINIGSLVAINDRGEIAAIGSRKGKPIGLLLRPIRASASRKSR